MAQTSTYTAAFERYVNKRCREWTYNRKQLRSITSRFVDTSVHAFVYLEVEMLTCVAFVLFTNDTGLTMLSRKN